MKKINQQELDSIMERTKIIAVVMATLIIIVLLMKGCEAKQQLAANDNMNSALKDSMKTWKDKEGHFKASITLLENYNSKAFTDLASADSTITKLQKLVKKYEDNIKKGGSVTTIGTEANINIVTPTKIEGVTKVNDTIHANYKSDFNIKGWVWGTVSATKDSTTIDMRFKEEIDVAIGTEKTGFLGLGKSKPFAEVTLHNPFNEVKTLRAYSTKSLPVKNFGVGPVVAYGVGPGFTTGLFVGIGATYSILKL